MSSAGFESEGSFVPAESLPAHEESGVNEPDLITIELLKSNPTLYRTHLMVLLKGMPYDRPIRTAGGQQAESLVSYCLDTDNIDLIDTQLERILAGKALSADTKEVLTEINDLRPVRGLGETTSIMDREKVTRRRLLAWVELLDELLMPPESQEQV